jgi:coatomer subunit gamma
VVTKEESDAQTLRQLTESTPTPSSKIEVSKAAQTTASTEHTSQKYAASLGEISEFKEFGTLLKSSSHPVELTEKETEYAVIATKHIFKDHLVLQVLDYFPFFFCRHELMESSM